MRRTRELLVCSLLVMTVWPTLVAAQQLCFDTNFADVLVIEVKGPTGPRTLFSVPGASWFAEDFYAFGGSGAGVLTHPAPPPPQTFSLDLVFANNTTTGAFGNNPVCALNVTLSPPVGNLAGPWVMRCTGGAAPFEVPGTMVEVNCSTITTLQSFKADQGLTAAGDEENNVHGQ